MDLPEIINSRVNLNDFLTTYGAGFLTEDQLRLCFIKALKLKAVINEAEIEKPYLEKEVKGISNGGILKTNPYKILLEKSRIELDLFYVDKNKDKDLPNYIEFKYHPHKKGECSNTKFGKAMNDLHRLSLLASSLNNGSQFYFVYAFDENMKNEMDKWKGSLPITELFLGSIKIFNAIDYVTKSKFGDSRKKSPTRGYGEFRKCSFGSFNCVDNSNKNGDENNWLPGTNTKIETSFLNDIKYKRIYPEGVPNKENGLYLFVIKICK